MLFFYNKIIRTVISIIAVFAFAVSFLWYGPSKVLGADFFKTIYETYVATETDKLEIDSVFFGGQFGASIAITDFNGDQINDLFIAAPFASVKEREWNGAVRVIFGADAKEDLYFYGASSGDQLGTALAAGDFNNDGIGDIAISAYKAYVNSNRVGKVYLIYGGTDWNDHPGSQGVDLAFEKPGLELSQGLDGAGFGLVLKTLDLNNDNVDDILIGAPFSNSWRYSKAGVVYAYFGADAATGIIMDRSYDLIFNGNAVNERFGASINGGDINGDGQNDVLIGAYYANNGPLKQAGKVYFYDGLSDIEQINNTPTKTLAGKAQNAWFGFSMDTGDINADDKEEFAVGSFSYKGTRETAKVEIFAGVDNFIDMPSEDVPLITIENPLGESLPGASILLEDLNSDGMVEIIIGAPGVSQSKSVAAGDVYIIYSGSNYKDKYSLNDKEIDTIIHGENIDDWFGYSLAVGDFNNDQLNDLVIGSRYSDSDISVNDGKVFVLFGSNFPYGDLRAVFNQKDKEVSRGEFIKIVLDSFNVKEKKVDVIQSCYEYRDFCLFNFMSMSSFDGITLEPDIILYPDVDTANSYYEDITTATILGIVNGYINEQNSPFKPEEPITRMQALKVIFGAADLVPPKYQFELIAMLGSYEDLINQTSYFEDVDSKISYMWWYPRYTNFAVENDIIDDGDYFRPHDNISVDELDDMINRTLKFIDSRDEKADT